MIISPMMRIGLGLAGVAAFGVMFALRDQAIERRGETKALAKVERATNEAVSKAQSAGRKSSGNYGGVLNPYYRD